jgi:hypothetical protein
MNLDQDEQLLVDALHRTAVMTPDLAETARRATRRGSRLRHRNQAGTALAALAVAGVVGGVAFLSSSGDDGTATDLPVAGSPTVATNDTPSPTAITPPAPQGMDTSSAYAVLDAPGWIAAEGNVIADEKLYYVQEGTDASVSLNWRPVTLGSKFTLEQLQAELDARYGGQTVVGTTTIDGDAANVFRDGDAFNVVGSIKQGRFLTLSSAGLTLDEVIELATHAVRQEPAHLAGQPQ